VPLAQVAHCESLNGQTLIARIARVGSPEIVASVGRPFAAIVWAKIKAAYGWRD